MSNEKDIIKDAVVESVINEFAERSKIGIEKYGTTLTDNKTDDFLQHLKEELMDATLYIQKLQDQVKQVKSNSFFNSVTFEDD
jgi:hypothetical protein